MMHDILFSFKRIICISINGASNWHLHKIFMNTKKGIKKDHLSEEIVTQSILFSIHEHSYKHAMHLFDIAEKVKDRRRKSKVFPDKPLFLKRIRRSIVARINIQF